LAGFFLFSRNPPGSKPTKTIHQSAEKKKRACEVNSIAQKVKGKKRGVYLLDLCRSGNRSVP